MVHYDPPSISVAQGPSPLCPKCGSHRTEVIGLSRDLKKTSLRCGACGVHSEIPAREAVELASAG